VNLFSHVRTSHPAPEMLALYSRGDLGLIPSLRLKAHLLRCANCDQAAESFGYALHALKEEAASGTLTAFEAIADWKRLESEMIGNIVVGVAASRCIENVGRKKVWLSRLAITGGLAALFVVGWITHIPGEQTDHLFSSVSRAMGVRQNVPPSNLLEATPSGIEVHSQGVTLRMLHPSSAYVSLSGNASIEARYVDEQSGQLTITKVYGQ
jgi:hypothetical protein